MDTFECDCCELTYTNHVRPVMWEDYTPPVRCPSCTEHYAKPVLRAEDHATEYRRRMEVAIRAAYAANDRADNFEAEMQRAFRSRERALESLDAISRSHQRDEKSGRCSCGKGDCPTLRVLSDPWLVDRLVDYSLKETGRRRTNFHSESGERLQPRRYYSA